MRLVKKKPVVKSTRALLGTSVPSRLSLPPFCLLFSFFSFRPLLDAMRNNYLNKNKNITCNTPRTNTLHCGFVSVWIYVRFFFLERGGSEKMRDTRGLVACLCLLSGSMGLEQTITITNSESMVRVNVLEDSGPSTYNIPQTLLDEKRVNVTSSNSSVQANLTNLLSWFNATIDELSVLPVLFFLLACCDLWKLCGSCVLKW